MRAAVTACTGRGSRLAAKLLEALRAAGWEASAWIPEKYMDESLASADCLANPLALSDWMEARMREETGAFVFVGACGIAVRAVAPWVNHKSTDPAVLAVDERGIHVISLLSGHMGGANRLARELAQAIGGRPVITTATDLNGLFAVDEFAARNGLHLSDWALAKQCAARLLEGERLGFYSAFPVTGEMPECLYHADEETADIAVTVRGERWFSQGTRHGQELPQETQELRAGQKSRSVLRLVPPALVLGIGCRRGTCAPAIEEAFDEIIREHGLDRAAVCGIASIDLKREEQGILEFAKKHSIPFYTYGSRALAEQEGAFTPSEFVSQVTGVDNVCERAAVCAARELALARGMENGGAARLLVRKYIRGGVTLAAACMDWRICFD